MSYMGDIHDEQTDTNSSPSGSDSAGHSSSTSGSESKEKRPQGSRQRRAAKAALQRPAAKQAKTAPQRPAAKQPKPPSEQPLAVVDTPHSENTDAKRDRGGLTRTATTTLITGVVAFFIGISANWADKYANRADQCYTALSKYVVEISMIPAQLAIVDAPNALPSAYNTTVDAMNNGQQAGDEVVNQCPTQHLRNTQYLNSGDVAAWDSAISTFRSRCTALPARSTSRCSVQEGTDLMHGLRDITYRLMHQANEVDNWGPLRVAWETLKQVPRWD
jgi:hypothetical protein